MGSDKRPQLKKQQTEDESILRGRGATKNPSGSYEEEATFCLEIALLIDFTLFMTQMHKPHTTNLVNSNVLLAEGLQLCKK